MFFSVRQFLLEHRKLINISFMYFKQAEKRTIANRVNSNLALPLLTPLHMYTVMIYNLLSLRKRWVALESSLFLKYFLGKSFLGIVSAHHGTIPSSSFMLCDRVYCYKLNRNKNWIN